MNANNTAKITKIPAKFDIWNSEYTFVDFGDRIEVKMPCREHGKGAEKESWTLGVCTEVVTHPNTMALIRHMLATGDFCLVAKNDRMIFGGLEVICGIPTHYGWTPADFY